MTASGKGSRGRWLKERGVEWLPKLLCPHSNTDIGHLLSVPTVQLCQISSAFPCSFPDHCFLLCSYQLPRSNFTNFKPHWQTWEYLKRIDVHIDNLTTQGCQTLLFSYQTLQVSWEAYKYLQIASQKKKKCFVFFPKSRLQYHQYHHTIKRTEIWKFESEKHWLTELREKTSTDKS